MIITIFLLIKTVFWGTTHDFDVFDVFLIFWGRERADQKLLRARKLVAASVFHDSAHSLDFLHALCFCRKRVERVSKARDFDGAENGVIWRVGGRRRREK